MTLLSSLQKYQEVDIPEEPEIKIVWEWDSPKADGIVDDKNETVKVIESPAHEVKDPDLELVYDKSDASKDQTDNPDDHENGLEELVVQSNHHSLRQLLSNSEYPYPCEDCGFISGSKNELKDHMTIHHELNNFSCEICGRNSQSEGSLREHIQRDHVRLENKLIECNEDCIVNDTNETDKKLNLQYMKSRILNRNQLLTTD